MRSPLLLMRVVKWVLGTVWGVSMLTIGFGLGLHVHPLAGLCVAAIGEYVLMLTVLDDLVKPVNVAVTGFMKLTAAGVVLISAGFVILHQKAILSSVFQSIQG